MFYRTQMLYGTQNVVRDNFSSNFYGEQIEFINIVIWLDWVCTLIRKYELSFSFKAATPSSINKCLQKCCMGQKLNHHPIHLKFLG